MNQILRKIWPILLGVLFIAGGLYQILNTSIKEITVLLPISKPAISDIYHEQNFKLIPGVYESLFEYSNELELTPVLAKSWGKIKQETDSNTTRWQIKIRTDALYSNGENIKINDYLKSLNRIEEIKCEETKNPGEISCNTSLTDGNFLRQVSLQPITKNGVDTGIGSGDYIIKENTDKKIILERTKGEGAKRVTIIFSPFETNTKEIMENGNTDIIMDSTNLSVLNSNYTKNNIPSLETFFLVPKPNYQNSNLANLDTRNYLRDLFQSTIIEEEIGDKLMPSDQFFSQNIVPSLNIDYEEVKPNTTFDNLKLKTLTGLEPIANYFKGKLSNDIKIQATRFDINKAMKEINSRPTEDQILLIGWLFENATVDNFLSKIVIPICTNWPVPNEKETCLSLLNKLIEEKDTYSLEQQRLFLNNLESFLLKRLMIIPLFETKTSIIHKKNIKYIPHPLGDLRIENIKPNRFWLF